MLPGWGGGGGEYREEDPFAADNARKAEVDQIFAGDNTGIDFDAYEDIPVEARTPQPLIGMQHQLRLLPVCWRSQLAVDAREPFSLCSRSRSWTVSDEPNARYQVDHAAGGVGATFWQA